MAKWLSWVARFWIILTLGVWAYGGWLALTNLPPQTATADEACNFYVGTSPNDFVEYVSRCLADPAIETQAREHYLSFHRHMWAMGVGFYFLLPLAPPLAILGLVLMWRMVRAVWRTLHDM